MAAGFSEYRINRLTSENLTDIYLCCMKGFRDYTPPFELSLQDFQHKFIQRLSTRFDLSTGAWHENKLVAVVLVSVFETDLYISCACVIPSARGENLLFRLVKKHESLVDSNYFKHSFLDVAPLNVSACHIYERLKYIKTRLFRTYRGPIRRTSFDSSQLEAYGQIPWELVKNWTDNPLHTVTSAEVLRPGITNDRVLLYRSHGEVQGIIVYDPLNGRIPLLCVKPVVRQRGIGKSLLEGAMGQIQSSPITILNIPEETQSMHFFMEAMGFMIYSSQHEMKKSI